MLVWGSVLLKYNSNLPHEDGEFNVSLETAAATSDTVRLPLRCRTRKIARFPERFRVSVFRILGILSLRGTFKE